MSEPLKVKLSAEVFIYPFVYLCLGFCIENICQNILVSTGSFVFAAPQFAVWGVEV